METTQAQPEPKNVQFSFAEDNTVDTPPDGSPSEGFDFFEPDPSAGREATEPTEFQGVQGQEPAGVPEEGNKPAESQEGSGEKASPEQYWQSRADKFSSGLNQVLSTFGMEPIEKPEDLQTRMQDLQQMQTLVPIARYIEQNPAILDTVEKSLSSGQTPAQAAPESGGQVESLKPPVKPEKPKDSDPADALDPESELFKYNQAMQQYAIDLAEYNAKTVETQKQKVQQEAMQRQQQMQIQSVNGQLATVHKYTKEQVADFWKTMDYLNNQATLDDLVLFHRIRQLPPSEALQRLQKAEQLRSRQQKLKTPTPMGVESGETAQRELTDEELFNESLLSFRRK